MSSLPFHPEIASIETRVSDLRRRYDEFTVRPAHLFADRVAHSLAFTTWESASAVLHLVKETTFTTAPVAAARAAFETAQDLFLLAVAPEYDASGIRAVIHAHLQRALLEDRMQTVPTGELPIGASDSYASALLHYKTLATTQLQNEDVVDFRNAFCESIDAFERFHAGGKYPSHWAKLSRRQIATTIGRRLNDPEFGRHLYALYSLACSHVHPDPQRHQSDPDYPPRLLALQLVEDSVCLANVAMVNVTTRFPPTR